MTPRHTVADVAVTYELTVHPQPRVDLLPGRGAGPRSSPARSHARTPQFALVRCTSTGARPGGLQTSLGAPAPSPDTLDAVRPPSLLSLLRPALDDLEGAAVTGRSSVAGRATTTVRLNGCAVAPAALAAALGPDADAIELELDSEHGTALAASSSRRGQPLREVVALAVSYRTAGDGAPDAPRAACAR